MNSENCELPVSELPEAKPCTETPNEYDPNGGSLAPARMDLLLNAAKALASTTDIDHLLQVIVGEVQTVIDCEGAGVLLYDDLQDDFYWKIVQDRQGLLSSASNLIRIPKNDGVCGWVFSTGKAALVHDAMNDPRLYRVVDDTSGFQTRNMVCVPLQTREKKLGVLYALNKMGRSFDDEDVNVMIALASNVALALENATYYSELENSNRELERLNRVKTRILHHLSHELKTPLSIIHASLAILKRKITGGTGLQGSGSLPFERIERNLERLKTVEKQVSQIVEGDEALVGRPSFIEFLGQLEDLLEIEQEETPSSSDSLELIRRRIKDIFPDRTEEPVGVNVKQVFDLEQADILVKTRDRRLEIVFEDPDPVIIMIQPHKLQSVINGLLRNAVENTPDRGKIVVKGNWLPSGYRILVKDHGVGIPESEKTNIFEGFYPMQEADVYTSGRPYAFNAGGTGTDLLKIKTFSEWIGFKIKFQTERCSCIPTVADLCPGDIEKCSCCASRNDCLINGGSEFAVDFPAALLSPSCPIPPND
ncbi:MAG: GAF domain-containing protein [Desulfomonilaceae bacterium]